MGWLTVQLRVTTPLFNAGADQSPDPDQESPDAIRVSSLRGAMRFWLRALAGPATATATDLTLLAKLEERVLGSTDTPSPLALRIPTQPALRYPRQRHDFLPVPEKAKNHPARWIVYLLGQSLGDLAQCTLRRPYVPPGAEFELKLKLHHSRHDSAEAQAAISSCALATLWLTCTYGGIGGRVRRGFGGLRITGVKGELPGSWTLDDLLTPGLDHYQELTHLGAGPHLAAARADLTTLINNLRDQPPSWDDPPQPPPFPMLSQRWTHAGLGDTPHHGWDAVLADAGEQLRHFRASLLNTNPDAQYSPKIKTPEWPAVVHGPTTANQFPLGALGLPVVYKDGYIVDAIDLRGGSARRASPLWLRPVGNNTTWQLFSFAFLGEFLPGPDSPDIKLRKANTHIKPLTVTHHDIDRLTRQWIDVQRSGGSFVRPSPHTRR